MSRIDGPLDQTESQNRDPGIDVLAIVLNVAAPIIGLLTTPASGAAATILAFTKQFLGQERQRANAEALRDGLKEGVSDLGGRLETVEKRLAGIEAEEAVILAVRQTLVTARVDKARRFGWILGATLSEDAPNWQEAAEFIRNLEEFSDADLETLKILWKVQRTAYRVINKTGPRKMSTDANDYTKTWTGVLDHAQKAGVSKDDWSSRCARLGGFGLTVLVQPNPSFQRTDDTCYRLTGRAVRLLKLLGRNVDPSEYPKVLYNAAGSKVTVEDEDQAKGLGEGWPESPDAFGKPPV